MFPESKSLLPVSYKQEVRYRYINSHNIVCQVKHVLSTLDTAHCYVESLFDGMDFSTNVTRARFDNEISKVRIGSSCLTELKAALWNRNRRNRNFLTTGTGTGTVTC